MKVALYARVATQNPDEQEGIVSQIEALRAHATRQRHEVAEDYVTKLRMPVDAATSFINKVSERDADGEFVLYCRTGSPNRVVPAHHQVGPPLGGPALRRGARLQEKKGRAEQLCRSSCRASSSLSQLISETANRRWVLMPAQIANRSSLEELEGEKLHGSHHKPQAHRFARKFRDVVPPLPGYRLPH